MSSPNLNEETSVETAGGTAEAATSPLERLADRLGGKASVTTALRNASCHSCVPCCANVRLPTPDAGDAQLSDGILGLVTQSCDPTEQPQRDAVNLYPRTAGDDRMGDLVGEQ